MKILKTHYSTPDRKPCWRGNLHQTICGLWAPSVRMTGWRKMTTCLRCLKGIDAFRAHRGKVQHRDKNYMSWC